MAKDVIMFILEDCPHCKNAFKMMDDLKTQNPEYADVKIEIIEESKHPERTLGYDYYYVPTFFVDGKKIHEGVPTADKIEKVFKEVVK